MTVDRTAYMELFALASENGHNRPLRSPECECRVAVDFSAAAGIIPNQQHMMAAALGHLTGTGQLTGQQAVVVETLVGGWTGTLASLCDAARDITAGTP